jgi:hypothetical protein
VHVLLAHGAQHPEEEFTLRKLVGELIFVREVLGKLRVLHRIFIEILHRELLIVWDLQSDHLILFQVQLLVGKNISEKAELGGLHRRQEHLDCMS